MTDVIFFCHFTHTPLPACLEMSYRSFKNYLKSAMELYKQMNTPPESK